VRDEGESGGGGEVMTIRRPEPTISAEEIRKHIQAMPSIRESNSYEVLADYYEQVDPKLLDSGVAYLPAKSVEMGKVDQPMISHIRNGVWAIIELNEALDMLGKPLLDNSVLREIVALYVVHEIHKLNDNNFKAQFDISQKEASEWADKFGLSVFTPNLTAHDYQSVAVGQHLKTGYHSNLSSKYTLYKPWVDIADTLASTEIPCATDYMQKKLDQINEELNFYYHKFNESIGILSNLIHTGVASWASAKGLIPLLIFEGGIVYIGNEGTECKLNSAKDIEDVYNHFKKNMNNAHSAIKDPSELQKSKNPQGPKGLYKFDNVYFFYSGLRNVLSAFMAAAVLDKDEKNRKVIVDLINNTIIIDMGQPDMKYPPANFIDIPTRYITSIKADQDLVEVGNVVIHCTSKERKQGKYILIPQRVEINGKTADYSKIEINGTGLMKSQVGYRLHIRDDFGIDIGWSGEIISYSRAISGIRMQFIEPLIKLKALKTDNAVFETCILFGVDEGLAKILSQYGEGNEDDHHKAGGFWNYSYVIAKDLLERNISGITFKNISPDHAKIEYLCNLLNNYINNISVEKLNKLESTYLYPFKEKMLVWISENLQVNGTMVYEAFKNKSEKHESYLKGTGICKLSNDSLFDSNSKSTSIPSQLLSMLRYTFSNRLPIGPPQIKPKLEVSEPIWIELGLRSMGHVIKGGEDKIYYRLVPNYFYTPFLSEIVSDRLSLFNDSNLTSVKNIAQGLISQESIPMEERLPYQIWAKELAKEWTSKSDQRILRYAGNGFRGIFATYDIVFNKARESNKITEHWFLGAYLGMILAATSGCRVVVGENPICVTKGDEFNEIIKFDSPYASVKRVFKDRLRLSELHKSIHLASLILSMGYERDPSDDIDEGFIPKYLQKIKHHSFPGSSILKEIQRNYKKNKKDKFFKSKIWDRPEEDGISDEVNRTGLLTQSIMLDNIGGNEVSANSIHELARIGLKVAIPISKDYEPYKLERLFREAVKAIKTKRQGEFKRDDYVDAVAGRLLKMMKRAGDDQFYYKTGLYDPKATLEFAESFVDLVFYKLAGGQPGKLKRMSNDLSDGFFAATLYQRSSAIEAEKAKYESGKKEEVKHD
jgi:CRISPR-associated protein Csc3